MDTEPRKSSDVLLSLESKVDQLIALNRSQDLVIKVLANKLNNLIENFNSAKLSAPQPTMSAGTVVPAAPLMPEIPMTSEVNPTGFRRTSRPETFQAAPKVPLQKAQEQNVQFTNFEAPPPSPQQQKPVAPKTQQFADSGNKIPVEQRLVDKNGKAIFLANIEIFDSQGENVFKGRTNGIGKWQASLSPNKYKIKVSKQGSVSKEKIDLTQDITITGASTTEVLPILMCK